MALTPSVHIQTHRGDNVRIGPISVITLIIVICMAVLAVLAASTSHASSTIAERQAEGYQTMYLNELAGQEFVAGIDDALAPVRRVSGSAAEGAAAVKQSLDKICANARAAADGRVDCVADIKGNTVTAEFVCEDTRRLNVAITIRDDATYRIEEWKSTSAQQDAQTTGTLWAGA